jgi:hypothetical protein
VPPSDGVHWRKAHVLAPPRHNKQRDRRERSESCYLVPHLSLKQKTSPFDTAFSRRGASKLKSHHDTVDEVSMTLSMDTVTVACGRRPGPLGQGDAFVRTGHALYIAQLDLNVQANVLNFLCDGVFYSGSPVSIGPGSPDTCHENKV